MSLEEFKQVLREQYFGLLLDRDEALAAIPRMLGDDPQLRSEVLAVIRKVASAPGEVTGQRAERLAEIEALLGGAPAG